MRNGRSYAVYWHTQGEGTLKLPVPVMLQEELYTPAEETCVLPASFRRYVSCDLSMAELWEAFGKAELF